jgi:fimbrial chaperone protein
MGRLVTQIAVALLMCWSASTSQAASLRVAPILLDLQGGTVTSTLRLWNEDKQAVRVQVRVFKWTRVHGKDVLEPTRDVVASPPMTALPPGSEILIRVVRTSVRPLDSKESYRVVVDQLPESRKRKAGVVNVLVRHAIPLYFAP